MRRVLRLSGNRNAGSKKSKMEAPIDFNNKIRKRTKNQNEFATNGEFQTENKLDKKLSIGSLNGIFVLTASLLFFGSMYLFVRLRCETFPLPRSQDKTSPKDTFYETNARIHLKQFSLHGPRVVGSDANEIYAYQYIVKQVKQIQANALPSKTIVLDEQNVTGSFDIEFLSDFVSVYRNIKNVITMVKSETGSKHSLLMSCHFDSSVDSPGTCTVLLF